MKALTLLQPWASLVALGGHPDPEARGMAKRIETRSWPTNYRGPLAIHASKNPPKGWPCMCAQEPFRQALAKAVGARWTVHPTAIANALSFGEILLVCDLVDCIPITAGNAPGQPERAFGDYSTEPKQRYAWHLANVKTLPAPIPAKGSLGLWTPKADVMAVLERLYIEGSGISA